MAQAHRQGLACVFAGGQRRGWGETGGLIDFLPSSLASAGATQRDTCDNDDDVCLQATEYHLGQLKARLAKLRTELQAPSSKVVGDLGQLHAAPDKNLRQQQQLCQAGQSLDTSAVAVSVLQCSKYAGSRPTSPYGYVSVYVFANVLLSCAGCYRGGL